MTARYALYFVPPADHPLYHFGPHFLGRDAHRCRSLPQPALENVAEARLAAITEIPRKYGFHATLKPPFPLAEGSSAEALLAATRDFAANHCSFCLPPLEVRVLDRFIAMSPSRPCVALQTLGDDCVRDFDAFRAPPGEEELVKRRAHGLTPAQETLLERWGYPYVFEEFRPHFSLTERIENAGERNLVLRAMQAICPPESLVNVTVDSISIFCQSDTRTPFRQTARYQFGG